MRKLTNNLEIGLKIMMIFLVNGALVATVLHKVLGL